MKLNLSFVRTEHVNVVDERYANSCYFINRFVTLGCFNVIPYSISIHRPSGSSPITFFLNILTMALGNINVVICLT